MAVPEYDVYSPGDSGQQIQGNAVSGRNPAVPVPASDYMSERQPSPHLSLSSLENTTVTSVAQQETGNGEGDQAIREEANTTQLPHTECRQRDGRLHTSGYVSQSLDNEPQRETRNQAGALTHSCRSIKLSEPAIHEIIARSCTNRDPCFPQFCSLQARITSYARAFRLDGERVNRDMLAIAGFFYTCSGDGHETVTCYHCGCSPRVWRDGQEPITEHRHLSPYCKALPWI